MKLIETLKKITAISDVISRKLGVFRYFIGVLIFLVGLVFLVTPFTPGATFIIILGLQIIGVHLMELKK